MTSIAVMQCVEKGLLALDDDVSNVLHEFKNIDILTGFDEGGEPILVKAKTKVTLRWERSAKTRQRVDGKLID